MKTIITTCLAFFLVFGSAYAQNDSLLVSTSSTFQTPGSGSALGQILLSSNPSNRTLQILPARTGDGDVLNGYVFDVAYTNTGGSSNGFLFRSGTANRLIINETGNVGIGMTSPTTKLQVNGSFGIGTLSQTSSNTSGLQVDYVDGGTGTTTFKHNRYGGNTYFKRNSASGERTQLFFGGVGHHRMDIYNDNNEVKLRLHSYGDSYFAGGNVGIGNTAPSNKLHIVDNTNAEVVLVESSTGSSQLTLRSTATGGIDWRMMSTADGASLGGGKFSIYGNAEHRFVLDQNGNVGIGTTTPGNELEVNGTIRSKEVIVETTNWPDYVFEEDYDLPTLSEIEAFIKANKHLPEVPSAKEMEANGISLGEMNILLLKKIEELTLHTIGQERALENKKQMIDQLELGISTERYIREEQQQKLKTLEALVNQLIIKVELLEPKK
ncbi:MAG: hypothetical protein RLN81_00220 [Balneolaceae bacterium]